MLTPYFRRISIVPSLCLITGISPTISYAASNGDLNIAAGETRTVTADDITSDTPPRYYFDNINIGANGKLNSTKTYQNLVFNNGVNMTSGSTIVMSVDYIGALANNPKHQYLYFNSTVETTSTLGNAVIKNSEFYSPSTTGGQFQNSMTFMSAGQTLTVDANGMAVFDSLGTLSLGASNYYGGAQGGLIKNVIFKRYTMANCTSGNLGNLRMENVTFDLTTYTKKSSDIIYDVDRGKYTLTSNGGNYTLNMSEVIKGDYTSSEAYAYATGTAVLEGDVTFILSDEDYNNVINEMGLKITFGTREGEEFEAADIDVSRLAITLQSASNLDGGTLLYFNSADGAFGAQYSFIPEPGTTTLNLLALASLAMRRRRMI